MNLALYDASRPDLSAQIYPNRLDSGPAPSRFADSATKLTPQLTLSGHGVNYKVQIHVRDMEVNHPSGNGRPIRWQWKRGQYLFAARYNPV